MAIPQREKYVEMKPETLQWLDEVGQRALCKRETLWTTYWLAGYCCQFGIPGDFVECGIFAGVQIAAMSRARRDFRDENSRWIHAMDTFTGIPAGTKEDGEAGEVLEGKSACGRDAFEKHVQEWGLQNERIVIHEGFVEQTAPELASSLVEMKTKIAILRLDVDLYSPTKAVLEYLRPLVVPGGWIIVDDALPGVRQAVREMCSDMEMAPLYWQVGQK